MKVIETSLKGVNILEPVLYGDERGYFFESYNKRNFVSSGIDVNFVQDNQSLSRKSVIRGLHYQIKKTQGKLVRVLQGEIFDVAVDIRKSSPNFGKWIGEYLSSQNRRMLFVPPGFAHGFLVISEVAEVFYKATEYYSPEYERVISWNDSEIGIEWPLQNNPILSDRDREAKNISEAELFP
ncbi:MAG: dTDP-4-dehydrorhamnose 3,5-epimerase [Gammaproteobacteria bacterium]|nr:dTDP-4-dehydrorhamnose 3,5-epimerase [Gammaproteobacteria bacterium]